MKFLSPGFTFLILLAPSGFGLVGCTSSLISTGLMKSAMMPGLEKHGTETRAINQFTDALAEDKEAAFRRAVSTRFEKKAMRAPDAYRDLEILNLPKSRLEVIESTVVSENRREAIAKDAKDEKLVEKYQFIIVRDEEKRRWVVDDIMLRQKKKGTSATRSSAEVMDLLLTVREFLGTWQSADRDAVLKSVSGDLRVALRDLPEPWFRQMIRRVAAEYESEMARRPQAQMNESDAVVRMPSKNGFLLLKVVSENDKWLVSDIEVIARKSDDHPGSVLRQSRAVNAVVGFLTAYRNEDLPKLESFAESKFFRGALSIGDLTMIPLPAPDHAPDNFEIRSFAGQLTVMIPSQSNIIRLDLTTPELASAKDNRKRTSENTVEARFLIADVTIYDRQTQRQTHLKSAFTAPARAMLFVSALQELDLPVLRQITSRAFSELSWERIATAIESGMPIAGLPQGELIPLRSSVKGEVTELEFESSSGQICSIIMRTENGELKVDDLQYPDSTAAIASLRTQIMLTMPAIELAGAWESGDINAVKRTSSMDFNRLVWSNVNSLPGEFERLPDLLRMPVERTQAGERKAELELFEPNTGRVKISLVRENTTWVIDEISMTPRGSSTVELRRELRQDIARQYLNEPAGEIRQAHFAGAAGQSGSGVVQAAGYQTKPRGNLTLPPTLGRPASLTASKAVDLTPEKSSRTEPRQQPAVPDSSGVLRFGPEASTHTHSGNADQKSVPRTDLHDDEMDFDEHEGATYYRRAETRNRTGLTSSGTDGGVGTIRVPVTDPSEHPIEIPLD